MNRFDEVIDRNHTNCVKYDFKKERGKAENLLPMWIADMDFRTADEIIEAMRAVVDYGIFGYSNTKEDYIEAVQTWFEEQFAWKIDGEWLVKTPGVIFALSAAIRAFTQKGDAVLIQQPVYHPFEVVIQKSGRQMINNPLKYDEGRYTMDFEDMEVKIREHKVKVFILCSPHNPVGRVWSEEELRKVAEICHTYGIFLISDEIHCDFVNQGYKHNIFASLSDEIAQNCMICTAPSKTFNLAGLQVSNIFIPNKEKRELFEKEVELAGYEELSIMAITACKTAYQKGGPWLNELKEYLAGNLQFVSDFIKERLPDLRLVEPEGTYLLWLDFSALGVSDQELDRIIEDKANLWLQNGREFAKECGQFRRMNMACPRSILQKAMEQLEAALL